MIESKLFENLSFEKKVDDFGLMIGKLQSARCLAEARPMARPVTQTTRTGIAPACPHGTRREPVERPPWSEVEKLAGCQPRQHGQ